MDLLFIVMIVGGGIAIFSIAGNIFRRRIKACPACKANGTLVRPPRAHHDQPAYGWNCTACGATLNNNGTVVPPSNSVFD